MPPLEATLRKRRSRVELELVHLLTSRKLEPIATQQRC
jgi:hypothetical protein